MGKTPRFGVGVGAEDAHGGHGFRLLRGVGAELLVSVEGTLIVADGGAGGVAREEVGKSVGQAELGRGLGAPQARAKQPDAGRVRRGGRYQDARKGMIGREVVVEEGEELGELVGEVVDLQGIRRRGAIAAEGGGFDGSAAGRAADAKIDAARVEGFQGLERLGDLECGVVREQDAGGAEPNGGGRGTDAGQHALGRGAGEGVHGVVLGHPEAVEAERLDVLGEPDGVGESLRGGRAVGDGRLV